MAIPTAQEGGGTTYTAGTGIEITDQDVINAKVVTLTQAEYDALVQQEEVDLEAVYYISDGVAPNTAVTDVKMNNVSVVTDHVANIPLVSSSTNGVVPQGTAVSTQSQSTKFLREDGTWQVPSYTDDSDKVSKSGDTMTDNLTIAKRSGKFVIKTPEMTVDTSTNNGLTQDSWCSLASTDNNNYMYAWMESGATSSGSNSINIGCRNKNTSGTTITNSLQLHVNKNGSVQTIVDHPAEFRNAIGAAKSDNYPSECKIISIATGVNDKGFTFTYGTNDTFVAQMWTSGGTVGFIRKSSSASAVITALHGTYDATSATTTECYMRVGANIRALIIITSDNIQNLTVNTY